MLLQAIPVLHFFSSQKEIFYTYIDEEKPDQKSKEKKVCKEFISLAFFVLFEQTLHTQFSSTTVSYYAPPLLEFQTPPPDLL